MSDYELTRKWLWMQAMDFACKQVLGKAPHIKDSERDYKRSIRDRYQHVLNNWDKVTAEAKRAQSGASAAYWKYQTGWSNQVTSSGVVARYRDKGLEVSVRWPEIKRFIEDMLHEDQQLDIFDLLLQGAQHD